MNKGDFLKKEDLTKQLKFIEYMDVNYPETIKVQGKKDPEIEIIENLEALNIYKNFQGIFSIREHIKNGEKEPLTTGFLFGGGLEKIQIKDIQIINYGNKCVILLISGIDKIGVFQYERLLFPSYNEKDFDYLFCLYNQEKTNIYTVKDNDIINTRKIGNSLQYNENLGKILLSINRDNFLNDGGEINAITNKISEEIQKKYQVIDFLKMLKGENYIFIDNYKNNKEFTEEDFLKTRFIYE